MRVWLLGRFRVSVGTHTVEEGAWRLRKAAALVKLLALAPGHHLHRERAMDLLWPDHGRRAAANNLSQALHAARRALGPDDAQGASSYLASQGEQLVLGPGEKLWLDVDAFEEAAATARRSREPAAYRAALNLYAGELLPSDPYEEWAEVPREGLRQLFLALLAELASLHEERGEYAPGIEALRRVLDEEPTREEAHMGLMRLYALGGRQAEALGQYARLEEVLSGELGAEPQASSRALREEIATGRFPPPHRPIGPPGGEVSDPPRHNLPAPRTSFVGREREMLEVKRELAMTRLLTLTGAGGSGKTRLALEVARDLVDAYPDGAWLVELAGLSEGELVPQVMARALGVREQPGRPLTDTLAEYLRAKSVLLVLDNCEHVADSVAHRLDTLLDSCPRLKVLTTSREALGLAGEVLWRVSSLSVPDTDRLPAPGEMSRYEAVRLFVERARLRLPAFELTQENTPAVAEVCRKLDGIPLAIELATARMGTLSVRQISERLKDPLGLLSAGGRTAVPRQQTLRGTLDWSYELLSEPERTLFGHLAVFAGGWTLEAAEAVAASGSIAEQGVLNLLARLMDKSLVIAEAGEHGALRYRMLEPIRQYAREKLEESGEAEAVRRRHAAFFLALAERAEPELRGRRRGEWLEQLEREHDNMRAALGWSFSLGDVELGLRLAAALWEFWATHGYLSEGREWLERGTSASGPTTTHTRARALHGAGWIAMFQGDHVAAKALHEESLALYRGSKDKEGIASALANLGRIAVLNEQDLASLPALLEESMELRPRVRDRRTVAYLLMFEAVATSSQFVHEGRLAVYAERYRALHEESMALFREIGDAWGVSACLIDLGIVEMALANHDRATTLLREVLLLSRKRDYRVATQYAFFGLAGVAASQGWLVRAVRLWAAADVVRKSSGIQLPAVVRFATDYEGRLAAVRAELGEEAFERAWAEGRAMSMEQAVEYALSEEKSTVSISPTAKRPSADESPALTRREREVAKLVARGLTNRRIAKELVLSERTVENHVRNILKKLNLSSRSEVAAWVEAQRS